jgi:hypothetical protein
MRPGETGNARFDAFAAQYLPQPSTQLLRYFIAVVPLLQAKDGQILSGTLSGMMLARRQAGCGERNHRAMVVGMECLL